MRRIDGFFGCKRGLRGSVRPTRSAAPVKQDKRRSCVGQVAVTAIVLVFLPACDDGDPAGAKQSDPTCQQDSGRACAQATTLVGPTAMPSATSPPVAVADCGAHAASVCAGYAKCTPYYLTRTAGDEARCTTHLTALCQDLQAAGTPIIATLCDAALAAPFCQAFLGGVIATECWQPPGPLSDGAHCSVDANCSSLFCDRKGDCGSCSPRGDVGAACLEDRSCKAGLVCTPDGCRAITAPGDACDATNRCGANGACVSGQCQAPALEGEQCESGTCDSLRGLGCDQQRCIAVSSPTQPCSGGICLPSADVGDSCSNDSDCIQPAYCATQCTARSPSSSCQ